MDNYTGSNLTTLGFTRVVRRRGGSSVQYTVVRPINQPWPDDIPLINFCDGGPNNWGGKVWKSSPTTAEVTVYVD